MRSMTVRGRSQRKVLLAITIAQQVYIGTTPKMYRGRRTGTHSRKQTRLMPKP
jgi:hypothetical protein